MLYKQNGMGNFYYRVHVIRRTPDCIFSNLSDLCDTGQQQSVRYINLVLLGGTLSPPTKTSLVARALDTAYPACAAYWRRCAGTASNITTWQGRKRDRVKRARIWLAVHTPGNSVIQRWAARP